MESAIAMTLMLAFYCVGGVVAIALVISSPWLLASIFKSLFKVATDYRDHVGRRTSTVSAMYLAQQSGWKPNQFDRRHMLSVNEAGLRRAKKLMETKPADRHHLEIEQWREMYGDGDANDIYDQFGVVLVSHNSRLNESLRVANLRDKGLVKAQRGGEE